MTLHTEFRSSAGFDVVYPPTETPFCSAFLCAILHLEEDITNNIFLPLFFSSQIVDLSPVHDPG